MSLIVRIQEELSKAMRERDTERRDTLRLILSSLQSAQKELQRRPAGSGGAAGPAA